MLAGKACPGQAQSRQSGPDAARRSLEAIGGKRVDGRCQCGEHSGHRHRCRHGQDGIRQGADRTAESAGTALVRGRLRGFNGHGLMVVGGKCRGHCAMMMLRCGRGARLHIVAMRRGLVRLDRAVLAGIARGHGHGSHALQRNGQREHPDQQRANHEVHRAMLAGRAPPRRRGCRPFNASLRAGRRVSSQQRSTGPACQRRHRPSQGGCSAPDRPWGPEPGRR